MEGVFIYPYHGAKENLLETIPRSNCGPPTFSFQRRGTQRAPAFAPAASTRPGMNHPLPIAVVLFNQCIKKGAPARHQSPSVIYNFEL
jgi:hypothetical protein